MRILSFLPLLLALGCSTDSGSPEASGEAATPAASAYDASLADDPCGFVPALAVAEAAGVEAAAVTRDDVSMGLLDGLCAYDIEGTDHSVSLIIEEVMEDAEAAEAYFAQSYRAMTPDEVDAVREAANDAKAEMDAEGQIDATASDALGESGAGDFIAGMAANVRYEPIEGLGDQAVASYFRDQFNGVYVRHGNLIFQSSVAVAASPEAINDNLEPSVALARAVLSD